MRAHLAAIRRRAYTDVYTNELRHPLQAHPITSTAITTTIPPLNPRYAMTRLLTMHPAPYRNPIDMTSLKTTLTSPSNIYQGDPLAHLLHHTYHFDHRQFTNNSNPTPLQYYSADLTALFQPPYRDMPWTLYANNFKRTLTRLQLYRLSLNRQNPNKATIHLRLLSDSHPSSSQCLQPIDR